MYLSISVKKLNDNSGYGACMPRVKKPHNTPRGVLVTLIMFLNQNKFLFPTSESSDLCDQKTPHQLLHVCLDMSP